MKKIFTVLAFMAACLTAMSQELPAPKDVMKEMVRVNKYVMTKRYADPTAVMPYPSRKKNYASNIWTRGVYYEGLMALYSVNPRNDYYDYAVRWADFHKWGMRNDDTATTNSDNYCCAQTYIDLYNLCPEPHRLRKTIACMEMILNTPENGDWTWIDAIQMGMPVLTKMGKLTGMRGILIRPGRCIHPVVISRDYIMKRRAYGGVTRIFFLHIRNLTERIATGPEETDG